MTSFGLLKDIEREHWHTATGWLICTSVFGLLPLWAGLLMMILFSYEIRFSDLADNGQFAVYSTSLLSTGMYFSSREFKFSSFRGRLLFFLIFSPLFIVATLLFAAVTIANIKSMQINIAFLRYLSMGIFILSLPLVFITAAKNEAGTAQSIEAIMSSQRTKLENEFDGTDRGDK